MQVTNRPDPNLPRTPAREGTLPVDRILAADHPYAATSTTPAVAGTSEITILAVTPETVRPLPKAAARKTVTKSGGRKKLSSTILTDTPVKERLRQEQLERKLKKSKTADSSKKNIAKAIKQLDIPAQVDDVEENDSSGSSDEDMSPSVLCQDTDNDDIDFDSDSVKPGDWCLFQYRFDSVVYYVGKVVTICETKVTANFLKFLHTEKSSDRARFVEKPNGVEEADLDQIVLKLDPPLLSSEISKRHSAYLKFPFDFSSYNLGM